jgi:hypothetical protein
MTELEKAIPESLTDTYRTLKPEGDDAKLLKGMEPTTRVELVTCRLRKRSVLRMLL